MSKRWTCPDCGCHDIEVHYWGAHVSHPIQFDEDGGWYLPEGGYEEDMEIHSFDGIKSYHCANCGSKLPAEDSGDLDEHDELWEYLKND